MTGGPASRDDLRLAYADQATPFPARLVVLEAVVTGGAAGSLRSLATPNASTATGSVQVDQAACVTEVIDFGPAIGAASSATSHPIPVRSASGHRLPPPPR